MQWPQDKTFWSRLGITAAVLAAYYLGTNVPLPGLDSGEVARLTQTTGPSALTRVSILSLGVMPLLGTLILIEILKLLAPGVRRWEVASLRNRDRMSLVVICITLAMALLQATGIAGALEEVSGFVVEPGSYFRAVAIATMIAGTALAMMFVSLIDRAGLGCGLWLLLLAPALAELPSTLAGLVVLNGRGEYSSEMLILAGVYSAISIAGVVGIVLAARGAVPTVAACVWTPYVANTVITPLLFVISWLGTWSIDDAVGFATTTSVIWYLALALIVAAIVWLYVRSYAVAGQDSPIPAAPIAGTLAAILVAAPILETQLGVLLPLGSAQLIVAGAVAATLLIRWGFIDGKKVGAETAEPAD